MTDSQCRELFEAWFLGENPTITDKRAIESGGNNIYSLMTTRINWLAWQAAWSARGALDDESIHKDKPKVDWRESRGALSDAKLMEDKHG